MAEITEISGNYYLCRIIKRQRSKQMHCKNIGSAVSWTTGRGERVPYTSRVESTIMSMFDPTSIYYGYRKAKWNSAKATKDREANISEIRAMRRKSMAKRNELRRLARKYPQAENQLKWYNKRIDYIDQLIDNYGKKSFQGLGLEPIQHGSFISKDLYLCDLYMMPTPGGGKRLYCRASRDVPRRRRSKEHKVRLGTHKVRKADMQTLKRFTSSIAANIAQQLAQSGEYHPEWIWYNVAKRYIHAEGKDTPELKREFFDWYAHQYPAQYTEWLREEQDEKRGKRKFNYVLYPPIQAKKPTPEELKQMIIDRYDEEEVTGSLKLPKAITEALSESGIAEKDFRQKIYNREMISVLRHNISDRRGILHQKPGKVKTKSNSWLYEIPIDFDRSKLAVSVPKKYRPIVQFEVPKQEISTAGKISYMQAEDYKLFNNLIKRLAKQTNFKENPQFEMTKRNGDMIMQARVNGAVFRLKPGLMNLPVSLRPGDTIRLSQEFLNASKSFPGYKTVLPIGVKEV